MKTIFLNLSNKPSSTWSKDQIDDLKSYAETCEILDAPFPDIDPKMDKHGIFNKAFELAEIVQNHSTDFVIVNGEPTFTYEFVKALKKHGVICMAPCFDSDGTFVQFREY